MAAQPLRVLIWTEAHWVGGCDRLLVDLARGLVAAGHEVELITGRHPEGLSVEENDGTRVHYVDAPTDNFTTQGYCYSQDGVARFLARLEIVPDLVDVKLGTSGATRIGNRDVVQFTIGARLRQPGTTS